jgi:hypothetical protein
MEKRDRQSNMSTSIARRLFFVLLNFVPSVDFPILLIFGGLVQRSRLSAENGVG